MPHRWIQGPTSATRLAAAQTGLPELMPPVSAHRRLRGPYTAAGTVLRAVVPGMLAGASAALVSRHDIEILSAAPELRQLIDASRETLTSLAVPEERTRFYSRLRTRRIAHGLTELLRDHLAGAPPRMLVIEHAWASDPTDAELLAIMLRRLDPALLTLVIGTVPGDPPAGSPAHADLAAALARYTEFRTVTPMVAPASENDADLAAAYVSSDGTSDDPALKQAYDRLPAADRAALHDARADRLTEPGYEQSLELGAIPFHREHGRDPSGAGAQALRQALDYCIDMGFYDATVDFGGRGRGLFDWSGDEQLWWTFTTKMTTSLAALGRAAQAEELYDEARAFSTNPGVHQQAAYATAMLYTRHHDPARRDNRQAMAWINEAIAIASVLPDPTERTFQSVFSGNGRALIRVHQGDLPGALELVDACLARAGAELSQDQHRLHRSVLLYNRAQVLVGLGRLDDALLDYTTVIGADPNYAEYYLDRGNIFRRMGRDSDAMVDYEAALRLSPPFPEVYYNRADMQLAAGDIEAGLSGLDYVLELDPGYLDAYVNRAGVRAELGDLDGARRDADAGLILDPDNPHLHCVLGQLHAEDGRDGDAREAFGRALAADPALPAAWAGLAALAHRAGDPAAAVADLSRALDLGDDAALRYNRAVAYQALGRWAEALTDLDVAAGLDPDDPDVAGDRSRCRQQLGFAAAS
jgi:tetratricopeptide (TPR) repeat protein